jgi:hypothetical protein
MDIYLILDAIFVFAIIALLYLKRNHTTDFITIEFTISFLAINYYPFESYYQYLLQANIQLLIIGLFLYKSKRPRKLVFTLSLIHIITCFSLFIAYVIYDKGLLNGKLTEPDIFLMMFSYSVLTVIINTLILATGFISGDRRRGSDNNYHDRNKRSSRNSPLFNHNWIR